MDKSLTFEQFLASTSSEISMYGEKYGAKTVK